MRKPKPKMPNASLHTQLVCSVTEYDRLQESKKCYNRYALVHYLRGCEQIDRLVKEHNLSVEDAVCTCFLDRLQSHVLRFLGYNLASNEVIRNGKPEFKILRDSLE